MMAAPKPMDNDTALAATILTCSFRGDYELCEMLCESVDRFVSPQIRHQLYVPESDIPLFAKFASDRRSILSQESLLPSGFRKLPLPPRALYRLLRFSRRNFYVTPFSLPVRGWIAQQIMKLQAAANAPTEIILHVDSDTAFVRPVAAQSMIPEPGKVRLYRTPDPTPLDSHKLWHQVAHRLLGLPAPLPAVYHQDYIGDIIVWRRSVVQRLLRRIDEIGKRDWRITLARTPHFSEYILYGTFATNEALASTGHVAMPNSLFHCRWTDPFATSQDETRFADSIEHGKIACCLQSTIPMTTADRRRVLGLVEAAAARQSQGA